MSYHNLTNEEIVFLYYIASSVTKQYENTYDDKSITQSLISDDEETVIEITTELPGELLDEILSSKHYTLMKDVMLKLKPLADIIRDVEPELVAEIESLFHYKQEEEE
jgi:hypothetical protein